MNGIILPILVLAEPASAEAIKDSEELFFIAQSSYKNCVISEAVRLDDGLEASRDIARAAITSCDDLRRRSIAATSIMISFKHDFRSERALKIAEESMEKGDHVLIDQASLAILENRKSQSNAPDK